jgi:hypothetical protein
MKKTAMIMAALALLGCRVGNPAVQAEQPDSQRTVIDSIFPVEEAVRRFKAARNGVSATELQNGSTSRDELVERFINALEHQDTAALREMILNVGEFIDLYYPSSIYFRPPYKQSPEVRWFLMQENSNKGITRLVQRYGGQPTGFSGYTCADTPIVEGDNRLWDRCVVTWKLQPSPLKIFSTIIERGGRFKIMSYANDL